MLKYWLPLVLVFGLICTNGIAQTDTTLLQKKFSYVLPKGWSLEDRFIDGWADNGIPDPPVLRLDNILFDASNAEKMKKYIDLTFKNLQSTDFPDAKITFREKRKIHDIPFTIIHVTYTQDGVPWTEYDYFTPKKCGSICEGYVFSVLAPTSSFKVMLQGISEFEGGLRVDH